MTMAQTQSYSCLILGGARSGKSAYAEKLASHSGQDVIYVATAQPLDNEIRSRIKRHQEDRPPHWHTVEEPLSLATCLQHYCKSERLVLVDCLTMWVMNLLSRPEPEWLQEEMQHLLDIVPALPGQLILVSNETGMGVVPMGEITRQFVDESGRLHQRLAKLVDNVTLMVAGLPHVVKPASGYCCSPECTLDS